MEEHSLEIAKRLYEFIKDNIDDKNKCIFEILRIIIKIRIESIECKKK